MKKIVLLNRYGEKTDALERLLKRLFPECEICRAAVPDKEGNHLFTQSLKKDDTHDATMQHKRTNIDCRR